MNQLVDGMEDLRSALRGILTLDGGVTVDHEERLREELIDRLIYNAVFHADPPIREAARWLIRGAALALGTLPSSIQGLYEALGRAAAGPFTTPAINLRGLTYDAAGAAFRAAKRHHVGALIVEIARSEIGYTAQRPGEYAAAVLAAAIKEGWRHPVFIQGDHFQVNAKKWKADAEGERRAMEDLVREAIAAGFFNIDIDSSTLVDLALPTLLEQQRANFEVCADMTTLVRRTQPPGVEVSVGGEIGEVGKKNSTPEEFHAFMEGYLSHLEAPRAGPLKGISKISIQTGTSHGGVVGPDGKIIEVSLDFSALETIGSLAREQYGMAGAVQHGASTLPDELFHRFPKAATCEIHLATGFQNLMFDHPAWPQDLLKRQYAWCRQNCRDETKAGETEQQFLYKTRKKTFGPFKREMWDMPAKAREAIGRDLEEKFGFLYRQLAVDDSLAAVDRFVKPAPVLPSPPRGLT